MQDLLLPPLSLGRSSFPVLRHRNCIYADKTALVYSLCQSDDKIFLTRPRGFGKSLLISSLESLFKFGTRDFKGLAIEPLWKDKTYQVVRLDFSRIKHFQTLEEFKAKFDELLTLKFGKLGFAPQKDFSIIGQLSDWLEELPYCSLVCLIDEFDAPLTACLGNKDLFIGVRLAMSDFFSVIKSNDDCWRFLFMTGIANYKNNSAFPELNIFADISLSTEYGTLLGFTEEELIQHYGGYLKRASEMLKISMREVTDRIHEYYYGYSFDKDASTHVYCPWSVLNFLKRPRDGFQNYWFASAGTPAALNRHLRVHALESPEYYAENKYISISALSASGDCGEIDENIILTQAGYLAIKSVNQDKIAALGYPNQEISISMAQLYADKLLAGKTLKFPDNPSVSDLLAAGNAETIIERFNQAVNAIDYQHYPIRDEASCRAYIQVLLIGSALVPHVELHSALGRSDMEVDAQNFHWVFEFKFAETPEAVPRSLRTAAEQMRARKYGQTPHGRKLLRIALVFCGSERRFAAFEVLDPV